jgi:hypothetical protein
VFKNILIGTLAIGGIVLLSQLQRYQRELAILHAELPELRSKAAHSDSLHTIAREGIADHDAFVASLSPEQKLQRAVWEAEGRFDHLEAFDD